MRRHRPATMSIGATIIVVAIVVVAWVAGRSGDSTGSDPSMTSSASTVQTSHATGASTKARPSATATQKSGETDIDALFEAHTSDVEVTGSGTVTRLLSDDAEGDRHQRFIVELDSGLTILIAHNIDIAPRLNGVAVGDQLSFHGEYAYSDQGGTIHWTHHDPDGSHEAGWLEWDGQRSS